MSQHRQHSFTVTRFKFLLLVLGVCLLLTEAIPGIYRLPLNLVYIDAVHLRVAATSGASQMNSETPQLGESLLLTFYERFGEPLEIVVGLIDYYYLTNAKESAYPYLPVAVQADTTKTSYWTHVAELANDIHNWPLESKAWTKAGIAARANVKTVHEDADGTGLVLDDFEGLHLWLATNDTRETSAEISRGTDGTRVAFQNIASRRDQFSYYRTFNNFELQENRCLEFHVWLDHGTFFTLDVIADGESSRSTNYALGRGEWEVFKYRILGKKLNAIYWGLSEPADHINDKGVHLYQAVLGLVILQDDTQCIGKLP